VPGVQTGNVNTLVSLPPGGLATVVINATVRPAAQGTLSNTASITSPIDPGENNKSAYRHNNDLTARRPEPGSQRAANDNGEHADDLYAGYYQYGPAQANELTLEYTKLPDVTFITYTVTTHQ